MYGGFATHFFNLVHYGFAFCLLYLWAPRLVFRLEGQDVPERSLAYALRSVFSLIVIAYVLILIKLYEVIALLAILLVFSLRKSVLSRQAEKRRQSTFTISKLFFDWLDGLASPRRGLTHYLQRWKQALCAVRRLSLADMLEMIWLVSVLLLAFYLRFADAYSHAAPAMSDSYITLSWMKNAAAEQLFVDGIYPQGFYLMLDYLGKFSAIDPLYVLRYTGPIGNTLSVYLLYYLVARLSGNRVAGIVAALLLGVFGNTLGGDWSRQAATLSQEYGFLLTLPTLYFFYRWFRDKQAGDYRTGLAGACAVGLVHVIGYGILWLGVGVLLLVELMLDRRAALRSGKSVLFALLLSGGVSLVPALIGLLAGKSFHSNSLTFTFATTVVTRPPLHLIDDCAVLAAVLLLISSFFGRKEKRLSERFVALFGLATFCLYEFGSWITQSEMLSARAPDVWQLAIPLLLGMGVSVLLRWLYKLRIPRMPLLVLLVAFFAAAVAYHPPAAIHPDKLESDEGLEQYLRISQTFPPKSWMIVYSFREANNIIRGKGYHMYVGPKIGLLDAPISFLGRYDPLRPAFTPYGKKQPDQNIPADVFLFYEKHVYQNAILAQRSGNEGKKEEYATRENDRQALKKWLDEYAKANGPLPVYYDGPDLTVYHFTHVEQTAATRGGRG